MVSPIRLYDNTRISEFKTCPRKFYYRHVRDWAPAGTAKPLIFGSCWHKAMDTLWGLVWDRVQKRQGLPLMELREDREIVHEAFEAFCIEWTSRGQPHPDRMDIDDIAEWSPRTPMVAKEMLAAYLTERSSIFNHPSFELLAIEQPFAIPLDPEDETLFYVGRLDKVFRYQKRIYCAEHKTSTAYSKANGFRSDFLDSWSPNSQVDGYLYALKALYAVEKYGRDAAVWIDAALVHKTVHDAFEFIPIEKRSEMLDAWLWTVHNWIDQIEGNKAALNELGSDVKGLPYMPAFAMNTSSCQNYGACSHINLCKGLANPHAEYPPGQPAPAGFVIEHWSPFDELKLEKLGFTREMAEGE